MKRLILVTLTGALLATAFVDSAYAGDRDKGSRKRVEARSDHRGDRVAIRRDEDRRRRDDGRRYHDYDRRDVRHDRYFRDRDIIVVREYYRPYYQPLPRGVRYHYARHGHLPVGWERRIRPVPVYVERDLYPSPHGYSRGIIDGHVVVHNSRGFIFDLAVLF